MSLLEQIKTIIPKASRWEGEPYKFAEKKYDGVRLLIHKKESGEVEAFTRGFKKNVWPKIQKGCGRMFDAVQSLPCSSVVEGEAHIDRSNAEMATILAEGGKFKFQAFAMPIVAGELSINYALPEVRERLIDYGFSLAEEVNLEDTDEDYLTKRILELGIEGFIFKAAHYRRWFKVKAVRDLDVIVGGIKKGKGKYLNQIGSICCYVWNEDKTEKILVANISGMSDSDRKRFTQMHQEGKLRGRVIEIRHEGLAKKKLRFPRFSRVRFDKTSCEANTINDVY